MKVTLLEVTDVILAKVEGEVNTLTAKEFQAAVSNIIDEHEKNLVLDCTALDYLSSAGLRALFALAQKMTGISCTITLKNVQAAVMEVLEFSGFDEFFEFA